MTFRMELFVPEYVKTRNATKSAIKAGYSEKTAYSQGQRLSAGGKGRIGRGPGRAD